MPPRQPSPAKKPDDSQSRVDTLAQCVRIDAQGTVLDISVSPNAKRTEIVGMHDGALRIRLAAQPVEGQANTLLIRWLADELHIARNHIDLLRGDTTRRKQVRIKQSADTVMDWLRSKLQD